MGICLLLLNDILHECDFMWALPNVEAFVFMYSGFISQEISRTVAGLFVMSGEKTSGLNLVVMSARSMNR